MTGLVLSALIGFSDFLIFRYVYCVSPENMTRKVRLALSFVTVGLSADSLLRTDVSDYLFVSFLLSSLDFLDVMPFFQDLQEAW